MKEKSCVQIYTGDGKGKTTAALGLALRARGRGLDVRFIQFLKHGGCGEHLAMDQLGVKIDCGAEIAAPPWNKEALPLWQEHTRGQLQKAKEAVKSGADLVILDELLGAMGKNFISLQEVLELIKDKDERTELILTGRNAPEELIQAADLVTSMECIKHYMDTGLAAREGIEY